MTITPDPVDPGQGHVHRSGVRAEQPERRVVSGVVVTDAAGGSTTKNWSYGLKANVGAPTAGINPLPAKVLAIDSGGPGRHRAERHDID